MKHFKSISSTILGHNVSSPIGISSAGRQIMVHPDGECATAQAAKELGLMYVQSTFPSKSLQEIGDCSVGGIKMF